ncbi:MAG: PQQ-binding-like beta-propeller repeat protein [Thermoplasmata archaeon]|nr:MAG: PQQ-binding-like beta-propeller repeat protein [Thermoplasmata archaeon]
MSSLSRLAITAIVVLLLAGALPASSGAEDGDEATVAVLFDYGDGFWSWADVPVPEPANAWCATVAAAEHLGTDLKYSFSQFGVFLEGVGDVETPDDFSKFWGLRTWDGEAWESSMVGALDVAVGNGSIVAWQFAAWGDPAPSPTPNTRTPWTQFRGGYTTAGTAVSTLPGAGGMFWSVDLGNGPIDSTMAVADGKVFGITAGMFNWSTFSFDSLPHVFALDATTGTTVWKREFQGQGGFEIGSPAYAGGTLYVTVSSRKVMALDALDGEVLWETQLEGDGLSASPAVVGNRVLVGTGGAQLVSLHANNGTFEWTANVSGWVYLAAPAVADDVVYIGTDNATLHAFHLSNGSEVWTVDMPGRVRGTPLVAGDRIYAISAIYPGFVATEGFLHSLDLDGNELWNVSIGPTGSSPFLMGDLVLVGSQSGLWAIDADDGTVAWRYQEAGPVSASPVGNDMGALVMSNVNDTEEELHTSMFAIEKNGTVVWTRELKPHNWALSSVSVADGVAYTATDEGWVYALGNTPFVADFDFEVDGLKVTVTSNSTSFGVDNVGHVWVFEGTAGSRTGDNITHRFEKGGTYEIQYVFVDEFDRVTMVTKEVTVKPPPEEESPGFGPALLVIAMAVVVAIIIRRR